MTGRRLLPSEHARLKRLAVQAKRMGRDLFEFLDSYDVLLTQWRWGKVRAEALYDIADLIEQAGAKEIIAWYGSKGDTPLDLQRGIVSMIRNHAKKEGS